MSHILMYQMLAWKWTGALCIQHCKYVLMPKTMCNRENKKKKNKHCSGGKTEVSVKVVICIILHITFTSVYETQLNSCRSSLTYSDSLPQLSEPQHKMNWHKCLWKWNIRLEGSVASAALYGNHVLKSDPSLSEEEHLMERSHGMQVI